MIFAYFERCCHSLNIDINYFELNPQQDRLNNTISKGLGDDFNELDTSNEYEELKDNGLE